MSNRTPSSKRLRFEIFKRDGFECQYCGATPPGVVLHCDHIEPVSKGGTNDLDNLITACQECNQGKSNILLSSAPASMELRAAEIREREEQIAGYQEILRQRRERIDDEAQDILNKFCEHHRIESIPKRDFISIKRFIDELGYEDVFEACELGLAAVPYSYAKSFRYFCGVCWNKIRRLNGEA